MLRPSSRCCWTEGDIPCLLSVKLTPLDLRLEWEVGDPLLLLQQVQPEQDQRS
jgi:hypothetical protein